MLIQFTGLCLRGQFFYLVNRIKFHIQIKYKDYFDKKYDFTRMIFSAHAMK